MIKNPLTDIVDKITRIRVVSNRYILVSKYSHKNDGIPCGKHTYTAGFTKICKRIVNLSFTIANSIWSAEYYKSFFVGGEGLNVLKLVYERKKAH